MILPSDFDKLDKVADLLLKLEIDMLTELRERLNVISGLTPTSEFLYRRILTINLYRKESAHTISLYDALIERILKTNYDELLSRSRIRDLRLYDEKGELPLYDGEMYYYKHMVKHFIDNSIDGMKNYTKSLGFNGMNYEQYFIKTLDESYAAFIFGGKSIDEINKKIARELANHGLEYIDYSSGHRINAYSGARRALKKGLNDFNSSMSFQMRDQLKTNLVEVSAHMNARPEHADWQGKIYTLENDEGYENFYKATQYGSALGLCGINCRHTFYPFIQGMSTPAYNSEELEELKKSSNETLLSYNGRDYTGYEATQYQRQLENSIRKLNRVHVITKDANIKKVISKQKKLYFDFSKKANLKERYNLTY